jgi:hypothetical protein
MKMKNVPIFYGLDLDQDTLILQPTRTYPWTLHN